MRADAEPTPERRFRPLRIYRGWWIVLCGFLSQMTMISAGGYVLGVLMAPMQRDLGWTRGQVSGALTLSGLVSGAVALKAGGFTDRHGARQIMAASAIAAGALLITLGQVIEPWQYYLCWATIGATTPGLVGVAPTAAIANWFRRRRATALMVYTSGSSVGGILLAPAMALIAQRWGWRTAWVTMGLLVWCIAPLAWRTVRRTPEELGLLPDGDPPASGPTSPTAALAPPQEVDWSYRDALRTRAFWLLTAGFTLTSFPASSVFLHLAPYFNSRGFSTAAAATALSIYATSAISGRVLWGSLLPRVGLHRALTAFGVIYGASILFLLVPATLAPLFAATVPLGIAIGGLQVLQGQAYPDYFGRRIVGRLLAISGLALTVTRALSPLFTALTYDATAGYTLAFIVFGFVCFVSAGAFLLAPPPVVRPAPASDPAQP
ncbi:MAG: MFS transporter [Dehalococcoidia bacterium]